MDPKTLTELKKLYRDGFPEDSEAAVSWFFSRVNEKNAAYFVTGGKPVSAGYIIDKPAVLWGRRRKMPYLSALSTKTEYRGQGLIRSVITELLSRLYRRGAPVCALYPFNHDYYKRFGFCDVSFCAERTIRGGETYPHLSITPPFKELARVQSAFTKPFTNRLVFGAKEILAKTEEFAVDGVPLYVYADGGKPFAYCFISGDQGLGVRGQGNGQLSDAAIFQPLAVRRPPPATRFIYHYAATDLEKFSRCEQLKGCAYIDFSESGRPYVQGRVVNAKAALEAAPYMPHLNKTVVLRITDPLIAENNRAFKVTIQDGRAAAAETTEPPAQTLGIGELTQLLFLGDGLMVQKQKNIFTDQY